MKKIFLLSILFSFCITSCTSDQVVSNKADHAVTSILLSEVQDMLSVKLTREELESRLGSPIIKPKGNWGNLMYEMPDKKYLFFFFKGPHVTGARFDKTEIKGIEPKTYKMHFVFNRKNQKHFPALDDEVFEDIDSFKNHLRKLPKNSIIEWQHSDDISAKVKEPIETSDQIKSFEVFCLKYDIILIQYPGG